LSHDCIKSLFIEAVEVDTMCLFDLSLLKKQRRKVARLLICRPERRVKS
jgi:hypothetical protein